MKRTSTFLIGMILLITATLHVPSSAHAATFTVNSTTDAVDAAPGDGICAAASGSCTLRAAIQETNALAGADSISLPPGAYTLSIPGTRETAAATGDLNISDDLSITGAGAAITTIDGGGLDRVFHISGIPVVEFSSLTIQNGTAADGGGIIQGPGTLTLTSSAVISNRAVDSGGGISSGGELTLINSAVSDNRAGFDGGGINSRSQGGNLSLIDSVIGGNRALTGGGISSRGELTLINSTVSGNRSTGSVGVAASSASVPR